MSEVKATSKKFKAIVRETLKNPSLCYGKVIGMDAPLGEFFIYTPGEFLPQVNKRQGDVARPQRPTCVIASSNNGCCR